MCNERYAVLFYKTFIIRPWVLTIELIHAWAKNVSHEANICDEVSETSSVYVASKTSSRCFARWKISWHVIDTIVFASGFWATANTVRVCLITQRAIAV